jgi:tRNA (guanine37-N1)-methyltransferase
MKIDVLTLFPAMFAGPLDESIVQRARKSGAVDLTVRNLRDYTHDRHKTVDDRPFGGGPGMLLKPEPVFEAVEALAGEKTRVTLLSPAGRKFDQAIARELAQVEHLLLICGSYEGFDERIREQLADDELSIGDYVLTNGALPAMVVIDAVTRLLPGVLGDDESSRDESFSEDLLEYPHYTRPAEFRGMKVPEVLLSGNHAEIAKWRAEQARQRTKERRPDLLKQNAPPKKFMNQALLDKIESEQYRKNPLEFGVGDSVKVHTKVVEGDKERIQIFSGVVIGRRGHGMNSTFTVRRISYGEGVERVFPVHSPRVDKVEVERKGSVRRAKLTYLRKRLGKGATLVKEKEGRGEAAEAATKAKAAAKKEAVEAAPATA